MSARAPTTAARVFAAFLVARAVSGLVYLAVSLGRWPVPWYFPLERRWEIAAHPAGLSMGWFGTTAIAVLAALAGGALTWIASARGPLARALGRTAIVLAVARAGGLVLLVDFAYFGWTLTHQTPAPLPECPKGP
ncbi:MAG: hypothetical protein QM820_60730 [Minicystis sp.]